MTGPLQGDSSRQAVAPLRGYRYQILRTVYAWLDLSEGERLYLEGAEDFDRVSEVEAQATQVKHTETGATVTLRATAVVAAIDSYWSLRAQNPGRMVRLDFLTTARPGLEAGAPFGAGRIGLALWNAATQSGDPAEADAAVDSLRLFLLAESRVSEELLSFLRNAPASEVRSQLLANITWHSSEPTIGDVEAAILGRLRAICWKRGVAVQWAEKIRDRLERAAWERATRTAAVDRVLVIEDFYQHFDEVTTVPVAASAVRPELLANVSAMQLALATGGSGASSDLSIAATLSRAGVPPPLLARRAARETLERAIAQTVKSCGVINLHGATGLGKTTEAAVFAHWTDGACFWLNCRGIDQHQLRVLLEQAVRGIESEPDYRFVVVDDVDVLEYSRILEEFAPGLLYTLGRRGGGLLFTSDRALPQRLLGHLGASSACNLLVPAFAEQEVRALLVDAGLSDELAREVWTRLILAKTGGHPQLVAAHIATSAQNGFRDRSVSDLVDVPSVIKDIRAQVRLVLSRDLPGAQRDLLYRLSLLSGSFERRRALALAQVAPAIGAPGDEFDRLVGPWIERVNDKEYRLSPLLFQAGAAANGEEWLRDMHASVASAWLKFKEQTPWDVATILLSATLGGNLDAIVRLAVGLIEATDETWSALGQANIIFIHFYTGSGQRFPGTAVQRFYARWIQLQMASRCAPDRYAALLDRIEEEFAPVEGDLGTTVRRYMLLLQALARPSDALPVARLIRIIEAIESSTPAVVQELSRVMPASVLRDEATQVLGGMLGAQVLGPFLLRTVKSADALTQCATVLDAVAAPLRARCLAIFREQPDMGRHLADSLWLTELQKPTPQWGSVALALRSFFERALSWDQVTLAQGIGSVLVRVLQENLADSAGALALAKEIPLSGQGGCLVMDATAKVLFQTGRPAEALELWAQALDLWETDSNRNVISFAMGARLAAVTAAGLGDWARAAKLFARAITPSLETLEVEFAAGLWADAGLAAWKSGEKVRAVEPLGHAIRLLASIANRPEDVRGYYAHKTIGHVMTWLVAQTQMGSSELHDPTAGMCSIMDPDERITQTTPTPLELTQVSLITLRLTVSLTLGEFDAMVGSLRTAPYPLVRRRLALSLIEDAYGTGLLNAIATDVALLLDAILASMRQESSGQPLWLPFEPGGILADSADRTTSDPEFWLMHFCVGLLSLAAHRGAMEATLEVWRADSLKLKAPCMVIDWVDFGLTCARSDERTLLGAARSAQLHWSQRIAAIALILRREAADPRLILQAHAQLLGLTEWGLASRLEFWACRAVSQAWRAACEKPVTLRRPAANVAAILGACDAPGETWQKVGRLFLAAEPAVDAVVPDRLLELARKVADRG